MKTMRLMPLLGMLVLGSLRAEEWRKVAFVGDAEVKSISGVVELVQGDQSRVLHEKEIAAPGQVLRIWRGAEVIIQMKSSKSLVRAKGPTLLRLAPASEAREEASVTGQESQNGYVVRAVRGCGKYNDGTNWRFLCTGMVLPEGAKVRPYRDSVLDFYHPATRTACRVTDHKRQTTLAPNGLPSSDVSVSAMLAATAP